MGPCHTCNGPHLIKDCNESTCGRCKPNLDKHTPFKCPRKCPFKKHLNANPFHNTDNNIRNKFNDHNNPNLQLSVSTHPPDHMAEMLEATGKMKKYFKKLYMHNKPHLNDSNCHTSTNHYSKSHSDRHRHKPHNNSNDVNEITNSTHTSNNPHSELEINKEHHASDTSDSILNSSSDSE